MFAFKSRDFCAKPCNARGIVELVNRARNPRAHFPHPVKFYESYAEIFSRAQWAVLRPEQQPKPTTLREAVPSFEHRSAQARTKGFILWTPSLFRRGSALDPPGLCSPGPATSPQQKMARLQQIPWSPVLRFAVSIKVATQISLTHNERIRI
jgi:hypothetical protein